MKMLKIIISSFAGGAYCILSGCGEGGGPQSGECRTDIDNHEYFVASFDCVVGAAGGEAEEFEGYILAGHGYAVFFRSKIDAELNQTKNGYWIYHSGAQRELFNEFNEVDPYKIYYSKGEGYFAEDEGFYGKNHSNLRNLPEGIVGVFEIRGGLSIERVSRHDLVEKDLPENGEGKK